jgi:hypothetical protein
MTALATTVIFGFTSWADVRVNLIHDCSHSPWVHTLHRPVAARGEELAEWLFAYVAVGEDVTRMDRECLAAYGCKFEHTRQREDVLRNRIVVPVEG